MSWTFPSPPNPSVFVAAPADMDYMRDAVRDEFARLVGPDHDPRDLDVYHWTDDELGLGDATPVQSRIPLPTDPKCRALICFFGERIGTPLSMAFDAAEIGPPDEFRGANAQLEREWREGAEAAGGFPLTGSVFECLTALRSNVLLGSAAASIHNQRPPMMVLVVGERSMLDVPDPACADWGGNRHLENHRAELRAQGRDYVVRQRRWEDREAFPQRAQLRNFIRWLLDRNGMVRFVANEDEARKYIALFLQQSLGLRAGSGQRDPFKGLDCFDEEDSGVLFGRRNESRDASAMLEALWADPSRPTFFGLLGGSGFGKSSVMRAGICGPLAARPGSPRYVSCVMRPSELDTGTAGPLTDCLRLVLEKIGHVREREIARDRQQRAVVNVAAALRVFADHPDAATFVRQVESHVLKCLGPHWRLLLGFDQFEELLDQYLDPARGPHWRPLVEAIALAARTPTIGIVYTLQSNRSDALTNERTLGALRTLARDKATLTLGVPGDADLDEIIRRPFFEAARIELEQALVDRLRDSARRYADSAESAHQGSVLPLLSVVLQRLYRDKAPAALAPRPDPASASQSFPGGDRSGTVDEGPMLKLQDCQALTDVLEAIATQAEDALREARASPDTVWSDDAIGALLRRLVRLGGVAQDRLELPSAVLPSKGPVRRLADALQARRLIVPEPDGRVRLVHEALVHHWPPATKWLADERRLLELEKLVGLRARQWQAAGGGKAGAGEVGERELDEAVELISSWYDLFSNTPQTPVDAGLLLVRDYAFMLMAARPSPLRPVNGSEYEARQIHVAAYFAAREVVDAFLQADPSAVHALRKDRRTPVFGAAYSGDVEVFERLHRAGAAVDVADDEGWQPLHGAVSAGRVAMVRRLLDAGAAPDAPGGHGRLTPLQLAVLGAHAELVELLLDTPGVDPSAAADFGWTALHCAAQEGDTRSATRLLDRAGVDVHAGLENGFTALHIAARRGQADAIRLLVQRGARVDQVAFDDWDRQAQRDRREPPGSWRRGGWTPLHVAVQQHRAGAVQALVEMQADPDIATADGERPLHLAVTAADAAVIDRLLSACRQPDAADADERTPLHLALRADRLDIAAQLLGRGASPDPRRGGRTPPHEAAREPSPAKVRLLLERGADANLLDEYGRSALHAACEWGDLEIAQALLNNAGINPQLPDPAGRSALHLAAAAGHVELVQWLVRQPTVDERQSDAAGQSPLHHAAQEGHLPLVTLLAGWDANPPPDVDGWTPLLLAAQGGHAEVAAALLQSGADPAACAWRPALNVWQAAAETGRSELVAILAAAGGVPGIDAPSTDRAPALALALAGGWIETGHALLDAGASPTLAGCSVAALAADMVARSARRADAGLALQARMRELVDRLAVGLSAAPAGGAEAAALRVLSDAVGQRLTSLAALAPSPTMPMPPPLAPSLVDPVGDGWQDLPDDRQRMLAPRLSPVDGRWGVEPGQTRFQELSLPWHDDVRLLRLTDLRWDRPGLALYYLQRGPLAEPELFRLNGTSPPIHELNARAGLKLRPELALPYLRFFCTFVRGDEGPFRLLESMDDPLLPRTIDPSTRAVLEGCVRPATLEAAADDGSVVCHATVWYSNALFAAVFRVQAGGMVEMVSDEPIAGDLGFRLDMPIA